MTKVGQDAAGVWDAGAQALAPELDNVPSNLSGLKPGQVDLDAQVVLPLLLHYLENPDNGRPADLDRNRGHFVCGAVLGISQGLLCHFQVVPGERGAVISVGGGLSVQYKEVLGPVAGWVNQLRAVLVEAAAFAVSVAEVERPYVVN